MLVGISLEVTSSGANHEITPSSASLIIPCSSSASFCDEVTNASEAPVGLLIVAIKPSLYLSCNGEFIS